MASTNNSAADIGSAKHLESYQNEVQPCQFPLFGKGMNGPRRPMSIRVPLEHGKELNQALKADQTELATLIQTAVAVWLWCYTRQESVCFGCQGLESCRQEPTGAVSQSTKCVRVVLDDCSVSLAKIRTSLQDSVSSMCSISDGIPANPSEEKNKPYDTLVDFKGFSNSQIIQNGATKHEPMQSLPEHVS
jgi:hypothetical protein